MPKLEGTLLLVGAGKMGGAMLSGWLDSGIEPASILIQDPSPASEIAELARHHAIRSAPSFDPSEAAPAVVVLAVKPQVMDTVAPTVTGLASPNTLIISVAAGRTVASLARHFPPDTPIVRAMPNTPSSVGRGVTGAYAAAGVSDDQKLLCTELLDAVGATVWVDREADIDAVTAVSGSGPAYVFHLVEAMTAAGMREGLSEAIAGELARRTVAGAGELLHRSELPAATLRENVTSPGGTTAAALAVLMAEEKGLTQLMGDAVNAARRRAEELSG
ncbi:MAG: pyrroline-5-carboxylate reductase [Pseudomonadota bacterium]